MFAFSFLATLHLPLYLIFDLLSSKTSNFPHLILNYLYLTPVSLIYL